MELALLTGPVAPASMWRSQSSKKGVRAGGQGSVGPDSGMSRLSKRACGMLDMGEQCRGGSMHHRGPHPLLWRAWCRGALPGRRRRRRCAEPPAWPRPRRHPQRPARDHVQGQGQVQATQGVQQAPRRVETGARKWSVDGLANWRVPHLNRLPNRKVTQFQDAVAFQAIEVLFDQPVFNHQVFGDEILVPQEGHDILGDACRSTAPRVRVGIGVRSHTWLCHYQTEFGDRYMQCVGQWCQQSGMQRTRNVQHAVNEAAAIIAHPRRDRGRCGF